VSAIDLYRALNVKVGRFFLSPYLILLSLARAQPYKIVSDDTAAQESELRVRTAERRLRHTRYTGRIGGSVRVCVCVCVYMCTCTAATAIGPKIKIAINCSHRRRRRRRRLLFASRSRPPPVVVVVLSATNRSGHDPTHGRGGHDDENANSRDAREYINTSNKTYARFIIIDRRWHSDRARFVNAPR